MEAKFDERFLLTISLHSGDPKLPHAMSYLLVHIQLPEDLGGVQKMGVIHNPSHHVSKAPTSPHSQTPQGLENLEFRGLCSVQERTS